MTLTRTQGFVILAASALAAIVFGWPFLFPRMFGEFLSDGYLAIAAVFALAIAVLWVFDKSVISPRQLAVLAVLATLASATRIATSGVAGFELVFLIVILSGFAYGAKFGFFVGALTVAMSSLFFGGLGPWTAFQIFAVGWVGAGAGLVALIGLQKKYQIWFLALYAALASYLFGAVMNLWFWPFAVADSTIAYDASAPASQNLSSFLLYTLTTSTLGWDSVRAISLAALILLLGGPLVQVMRRAKV